MAARIANTAAADVWYSCRRKLIVHASSEMLAPSQSCVGSALLPPATSLSESVEWRSGWLVVAPLGAQAYYASAPLDRRRPMATRIYVGNLPYTADSQQLTQMFSAYGVVVDATVVIDRASGQSKGFGFVEMATDDSVQQAITGLNGTTVGDRTLTVNEARARPDRSAGARYSDRPRHDDSEREPRW